MNDEKKKYCVIDHADKQSSTAGFDPYQFWLNQVRRRSQLEGDGNNTKSSDAIADEIEFDDD